MPLPVDVLIEEHKLIIQAIAIIDKEITRIETQAIVDQNVVSTTVDFLRIYADKFHHGKEEGILFKALSQKKLSEQDHQVMTELVMEHAFARKTVKALETAKENYLLSKKEALKELLESLKALVKLYPEHIKKEDTSFFYPCMKYFSEAERQNMMASFRTFNQNFTDKRYKQIIDLLH
jgi:hemerythrin-like domain-containing protein